MQSCPGKAQTAMVGPVWARLGAVLEAHRADVLAKLAEIQENLKIIDHKIAVYRGSLAAGDADQLWAPVAAPRG